MRKAYLIAVILLALPAFLAALTPAEIQTQIGNLEVRAEIIEGHLETLESGRMAPKSKVDLLAELRTVRNDLAALREQLVAASVPISCTFTYTQGACQPGGTQTLTVNAKTPDGCVGTPLASQVCMYVPPACIYTYEPTGICTPTGTQPVKVKSQSPAGCVGTPQTSQSCVYSVTPTVSSGLPDLVPDPPAASGTTVGTEFAANLPIRLRGSVSNSGDAGASATGTFLSVYELTLTNPASGPEWVILQGDVKLADTGPVVSGDTERALEEVVWGSDGSISAGTYYIRLCVDYADLVKEKVETPNCSSPLAVSVTSRAICEFAYSEWGSCGADNTQTRTVLSTTPEGCWGAPVVKQQCGATACTLPPTRLLSCPARQEGIVRQQITLACTYQTTSNTCRPTCTETVETRRLSCASGELGSKTERRTSTCPGPVWSDWVPDQNTCRAPIACTFNYTDWAPQVCPSSGTQTRTLAGKTPADCTSGTPVLEQSCSYVPPPPPPACVYSYTEWLPQLCPFTGTQTRSVARKEPLNCVGSPALERSCTYAPPPGQTIPPASQSQIPNGGEGVVDIRITDANWLKNPVGTSPPGTQPLGSVPPGSTPPGVTPPEGTVPPVEPPTQPNPSAGTSVVLIIGKLRSILAAVVPFIIALTVLAILWGVFLYVTKGDDEEKRKEGQRFIAYGILALFVMVSVWGLVNVLDRTLGLDDTLETGEIPKIPEFKQE